MGNVCSNDEKERIVYMESKLEEYENHLNDLNNQVRMLRRENNYCVRRLNKSEQIPVVT